jgi:hypothetical protein
MVALISPAVRIWHDAEHMHGMVLGQLLQAKRRRQPRLLVESLAQEAQGMVRHILHRGAPPHLDLLAEACADLLEHGTCQRLMTRERAKAKHLLRDACLAMRQTGIDGPPLDQVVQLARISARMPRLVACSHAHLEVLAAPITKLLLALFAS